MELQSSSATPCEHDTVALVVPVALLELSENLRTRSAARPQVTLAHLLAQGLPHLASTHRCSRQLATMRRAAIITLVVSVQALRFGGPPGGRRPSADDNNNRRRRGAAVLGMVALGAPTAASAKKKSNKVTLSDKLRNVPAFFVANSRGSPYLINKEQEGAQECVIFWSRATPSSC